MEKCNKKLLRKTIFITTLMPLSLVFIMDFEGASISEAIQNSYNNIFYIPHSLSIWVLILLFNILVLFFLRPVFSFWDKYNQGKTITLEEKNRTMSIFNNLTFKITLMAVIAFVFWIEGSKMGEINMNLNLIPTTYLFFQGVSSGFFVGILIIMSLDNIYYPIKCALMIDPPTIKPKYKSYYKQMNVTILLLLAFLGFQLFSITADFYFIAFDRASEAVSHDFQNQMNFKPEAFISNFGQSHKETRELLHVFSIKILFYFLLTIRALFLLKKGIKNPLETVEERLEHLTSNTNSITTQINIVDNNEFSTIYTDINKLIVKQQSELENSKQRLHTIIDNAADPIISFDDEGAIFIFNPAAEKMFGWNWKEIQGKEFSKLFDDQESYCIECGSDNRMFVKIVTDAENHLQRYKGKTKSGESITFETNFSSSDTPNGKIHTVIIRDITKQIEFENSLKDAKISAEKANKLKSVFLANMSHELRTPLNAVLGFTQLLNTDKNLTKSQVEKLNIISNSGEHLLGLINDILDISKIEAGKIELHKSTFNLREFTEDLKQMFELRCKKNGLSFYVEYVDPFPEFVYADLGKLRQIMINIIGNSVKFTKDGGISIVVGVQNNKLRFSVNDTGKGIPENEIISILQPFNQSSITDHEGGTGLGLAITNSFIEMMGGKLEIESKVDVGSTFSFNIDFEIADKADNIIENKGIVLGIKDDRHPTAIIVDDKINNRLILKEMLEKVGFVTIEATNGLEAFERTKEFKPELVFMDIKMPIMDGYEAVKKIKTDNEIKDIPVFALTASAFKHDEKSIIKSGFNGFIAKPFKLTSLFNLISENSDIEFIYEAKHVEINNVSIHDLNLKQVYNNIDKGLIDQIDELALINDFVGIQNILEPLRSNEQLVSFIDTIFYLTDSFDDDSLLELINNLKEIGE